MNTIKLNAFPWTAEVSPDHGMNVFKLLYKGDAVLRSPESGEKLNENAVVYGTPMLLPPDRTRGQRFTFNGRGYSLENFMHGSICRTKMKVLRRGESFVEAEYVNKGEVYPFPFTLRVLCSLDETGLKQRFGFTNTGSEAMPLAFGLHTTFAAKDSFSVSLGQKWATDSEYFPSELVALPENETDVVSGRSPQGYRLHGMYSDNGCHQATSGDYVYRVSPNFNSWVLWNLTGQEGFISLEPQNGPVNSLNMADACPVLAPGETAVYETCISRKDSPSREED